MFLQFLDLYGNPVYVRPERVDGLRGVSVSWEGKPRAATFIVLSNRETFRVRGHVDTIMGAIEAWYADPIEPSVAQPVSPSVDPNSASGYRSMVEGSI